MQFVGESARIGVGFQNGTGWRGEVMGVLSETTSAAWLGDGWVSGSAGGLKLSRHTQAGESVRKYFLGVDQNAAHDRKISFGLGLETADWFGHTYLSYSPGDRRQLGQDIVRTDNRQIDGAEAGRDYYDVISTVTTTRLFERAYEYGIGGRIGHYFAPQDVRVTAGVDYEWARGSARQWGASLIAEKFFVGTPHSIALQGDLYRKSGSVDVERDDQRIMLMYRYSFGKASSRPARQYREVAVSPVAPAPQIIPAHTERKLVKTLSSMNGDAFFQLGKAKLTEVARQELDKLAELLAKNPREGNVRIVGHTCDLGSVALNNRLSLQRANAVRDYLVSKGALKADEVVLEGKGKSEPKYPQVKGIREKNRRVDLEFVSILEKEELVQIPEQRLPEAAPVVTYKRELVEQEPSWLRRALRTPAEHKRTVDTYRSQEQTQTATTKRTWVNRPPQAKDDAYQVMAGSVTNLNVLGNDLDSDAGDVLSLVSVATPSQGQVRIDGGQLVYTAPDNFSGQVKFSYVVKDSQGATASANIVVNVEAPVVVAPNQKPVAKDDRFEVSGVTESTLDVTANDSDPDGDTLQILSVTQPQRNNGTVLIDGNRIRFIPSGRFSWDTFSYTVSDGRGGSSTATVLLVDP